MKALIQYRKPELVLYLTFLLLVLATAQMPFFWDTIQFASRHTDFFFKNGFRSIILPNEIDSGHIPTLGIYLAAVWKIFGRSLVVSHLAMLPFVMGIVWQSINLSKRLFDKKWYFAALVVILVDPTLLAQCTLVSPDVILVFFFLLSLNNLQKKERTLFSIALAGLSLSSMRGMMCAGGLFFAEVIIKYSQGSTSFTWKHLPRTLFSIIKPYIPVIFIASLFFGWHYYKTGWIGYLQNMRWVVSFESQGFKVALFNTLILGWRLIDFGHLFVWVAAIFCMWHYFRNRPSLPQNTILLAILFVTQLLSIAHAFILHKNLSCHRYLLPVYITFSLLVLSYLYIVVKSTRTRNFFTFLLIIGLLTGNFWIYPDRIAKGWDATIAYIPYFPLREKMLEFMDKNNISPEETGTCFPNAGQIDQIDFSGNKRSFAEKDMTSNKYIFYSNIFNDFSDAELKELQEEWGKIEEFRFLPVKVILYKNPHISAR